MRVVERDASVELALIEPAPGWRDDLDQPNVTGLRAELLAGKILPPIRIEEMDAGLPGYRVISGFHRLAAHLEEGELHIRADIVQYESEEEREADGLLENVRRRVLSYDERNRSLARLVELRQRELPKAGAASIEDDSLPPHGAKAARKTQSEAASEVAAQTGHSQRVVERAVDAQRPLVEGRCKRGCRAFTETPEGKFCTKCKFVALAPDGDAPPMVTMAARLKALAAVTVEAVEALNRLRSEIVKESGRPAADMGDTPYAYFDGTLSIVIGKGVKFRDAVESAVQAEVSMRSKLNMADRPLPSQPFSAANPSPETKEKAARKQAKAEGRKGLGGRIIVVGEDGSETPVRVDDAGNVVPDTREAE